MVIVEEYKKYKCAYCMLTCPTYEGCVEHEQECSHNPNNSDMFEKYVGKKYIGTYEHYTASGQEVCSYYDTVLFDKRRKKLIYKKVTIVNEGDIYESTVEHYDPVDKLKLYGETIEEVSEEVFKQQFTNDLKKHFNKYLVVE